MQFPAFIISAALVATALFLYRHPHLHTWQHAIAATALFIGAAWMIENVISGIFLLLSRVTAALTFTRTHEFAESDDDAQISESQGLQVSPSPSPVLVEVDTAGTPTSEVQVYEYLWNAALSAYELSRVTPLSEYHLNGHSDYVQILSATPLESVVKAQA